MGIFRKMQRRRASVCVMEGAASPNTVYRHHLRDMLSEGPFALSPPSPSCLRGRRRNSIAGLPRRNEPFCRSATPQIMMDPLDDDEHESLAEAGIIFGKAGPRTEGAALSRKVELPRAHSCLPPICEEEDRASPRSEEEEGGEEQRGGAEEMVDEERFAVARRCIQGRDLKKLEVLLDEGASASMRDEQGNTLLHVACQNNSKRATKCILRADGGLLDACNAKGQTALHYCYGYKHTGLASYLESKGAATTIRNHAGLIPRQCLFYGMHGRDRNVDDGMGGSKPIISRCRKLAPVVISRDQTPAANVAACSEEWRRRAPFLHGLAHNNNEMYAQHAAVKMELKKEGMHPSDSAHVRTIGSMPCLNPIISTARRESLVSELGPQSPAAA